MNLKSENVEPTCSDFKLLVHELNLSLNQITSDSGEGSFSSDDFDSNLDGCVVVYCNQTPVACGVFRHYESKVCELKRMYSKQSGAGTFLLKQLENCAIRKDYCKAILSTRRVNKIAVNFYRRHSYLESEAYGKYIGAEKSICLSKILKE